jgi:two-component system, sensor histidine kinase LadS
MQKRVSFDEFRKLYPDNDACYRFIDELKSSKDFICKKCHYHKCSKGVDHSRRCSRCNYVETIITGTIFAGIKFPITKAFYLLFLMSDGRHYTIGELSELVDLRQQTCWTFKKRVEERTRNLNIQKNKDGWIQVIMLPDLAHEKS